MVADPKLADAFVSLFSQSAVVDADWHRPDIVFQRLETQRGMLRVFLPKKEVF